MNTDALKKMGFHSLKKYRFVRMFESGYIAINIVDGGCLLEVNGNRIGNKPISENECIQVINLLFQ